MLNCDISLLSFVRIFLIDVYPRPLPSVAFLGGLWQSCNDAHKYSAEQNFQPIKDEPVIHNKVKMAEQERKSADNSTAACTESSGDTTSKYVDS